MLGRQGDRFAAPSLRSVGPGLRVVFRKIGKDLSGRFVSEASQSCSIVVCNEAVEESVAIGMRYEGTLGGTSFRVKSDGFADATVKAFDHAVGLRPIGPNETVEDSSFGAEFVEGMVAGRLILRLVLHVDGEAVGELAAVVGEDGVHRIGCDVLALRIGREIAASPLLGLACGHA